MRRTYKPRIPAGEAPPPKTGGRGKGSLNKSTVAIREAMQSVFADLQATTGKENGHLLKWAPRNPSDFLRPSAQLLPAQAGGADGEPRSLASSWPDSWREAPSDSRVFTLNPAQP